LAEAQQATAALAQRYQALFDLAPEGYLVTDAHGQMQELNQAAATLLAIRQDYAVGKPVVLFVVPEERQAFRTQLDALRAVPRRQHWTVRLQPREGPPFDAELTVAWMAQRQGQPASLLWHVRDVTARQQAAAALRASEARSTAILQTAVDGIITIDEHGRIMSFNPAAERLFGYRADDVLGQNVRMLMPTPYREGHDGYLARYLQTGERKIIGIGRDVRAQRRDGTTFPIALAVSELHLDGRRLFTGIVHDLTERVRLEEAPSRSSPGTSREALCCGIRAVNGSTAFRPRKRWGASATTSCRPCFPSPSRCSPGCCGATAPGRGSCSTPRGTGGRCSSRAGSKSS
jgi:two-component system sensor kinase FixL